jgi:hypothetical protein
MILFVTGSLALLLIVSSAGAIHDDEYVNQHHLHQGIERNRDRQLRFAMDGFEADAPITSLAPAVTKSDMPSDGPSDNLPSDDVPSDDLVVAVPFDGSSRWLAASTGNDVVLPAAPTTAPPTHPALSNDACTSALPVTLDERIVGTTVGATNDNTTACGMTFTQETGGVWYSFNTTEANQTVQVSVCGGSGMQTFMDIEVKLYIGVCGGEFQCVAGNNDNSGDPSCPVPASSVTWTSTAAGEAYFILVHGFLQELGNFSLLVTEATRAPPPENPPDNDLCPAAFEIQMDTVYTGTTINATAEYSFVCGAAFGQSSPGVWYTFIGNGTAVKVSTCVNSVNATLIDTQIKVYVGNCSDLECVGGSDDDISVGCRTGQSGISWMAMEGFVYFILVEGFLADDVGEFGLLLTASSDPLSTFPPTPSPVTTTSPTFTPPPPLNDRCDAAFGPLDLGALQKGSTLGSSNDFTPECGSASTQTAGGVWYTFVGRNGTQAKASTCDPNTTQNVLDTQIKVFSGNCSALECVEGNDDDIGDNCIKSSGAVWNPVEGQVYYILVHGYLSNGDFGLVMTEFLSAPNDFCENAAGPLALGVVVNGTTVGSTSENTAQCGDAVVQISGGVWYYFVGDGTTVIATTCHGDPDIAQDLIDTQIKVYTGTTCGELDCVAGNDDDPKDDCVGASGVVWTTVKGQVYYILVHGTGRNGEFGLLLAETTPAPTFAPIANDFCQDATPLIPGLPVQGSTVGASPDGTGVCGSAGEQDTQGVWYTLSGQGNNATATTCGGLDTGLDDPEFDTIVKVYTGGCEALVCVTGNDDHINPDCGVASAVGWFAQEGQEYYIVVHGFAGRFGKFGLLVSETEPSPPTAAPAPVTNDICRDAIGPLSFGTVVPGSTFGATNDGTGRCGTASNQTSPGVWYTYVGRSGNRAVKASTCHGDPDISNADAFDSQIKVFQGSCGALKCVAGNDDDVAGTCKVASGAIWNEVEGVRYYILVHGFEGLPGSFGLVVTNAATPSTVAPNARISSPSTLSATPAGATGSREGVKQPIP